MQRALGSYIDIDRIVSVAQAEAAYTLFVVERARETVAGIAARRRRRCSRSRSCCPPALAFRWSSTPLFRFALNARSFDRCTKASAVAHTASVKRFGADPVSDHKKALSRERSRQYRERQRAASG